MLQSCQCETQRVRDKSEFLSISQLIVPVALL